MKALQEIKSKYNEISIPLKIGIFIVALIFSSVIFAGIGLILAALFIKIPIQDLDESMTQLMQNTNAQIIIQIVSSFGMFVLIPILYAKYFETKNPWNYLKAIKSPSIKMIGLTIIVFFLANFVLDLLVKFSYNIPFESMDNEIIQNLLAAEKNAEETLKNFLNFKSPIKFFAVFTMMAILPALGEELTFRGVFLNQFKDLTNNPIAAISISALIFAVIHVQLHNFLAIFFMGILLGWIYHLTKNIWVSVIAHLFNNGLIVVMSYLNNIGIISFDFTQKDEMPLIVSIFGAIIFFVVFFFYKKFIETETLKNNG